MIRPILILLLALAGCARPQPPVPSAPVVKARAMAIPAQPMMHISWEHCGPDVDAVRVWVSPEPTQPYHFERGTSLNGSGYELPDKWRGPDRTYIVRKEDNVMFYWLVYD